MKGTDGAQAVGSSAVLHRHLSEDFLVLSKSEGNYLILEDGRRVFDASGGAAVSCIGYRNKRVADAAYRQILDAPYCSTVFYTTKVQEELCRFLVDSTGGQMARAYIVNSGKFFRHVVSSCSQADQKQAPKQWRRLSSSRGNTLSRSNHHSRRGLALSHGDSPTTASPLGRWPWVVTCTDAKSLNHS